MLLTIKNKEFQFLFQARITSYNVCYTKLLRVSLEEELELFILDRQEHVEQCLRPALQEGKIVLTDRYYFSTAAYQGAAGLDPEKILARHNFAPEPDLVILLTQTPAESVARIRDLRGEVLNDFEQQDQLEKVVITSYSIHYTKLYDTDTVASLIKKQAAGVDAAA